MRAWASACARAEECERDFQKAKKSVLEAIGEREKAAQKWHAFVNARLKSFGIKRDAL